MFSVVEKTVVVAIDDVGAVSKKSDEQAANDITAIEPANMLLIYLFIFYYSFFSFH
jgi:hypothetical protein